MKFVTYSALSVLLGTTSAFANTVQLSATYDVDQDILVTGTGDPMYQDPFSGEFIFWEEYIRIVNEEASVWDPTVIPTSPTDPRATQNLVSEGVATIDATVTFDASILAQDLTGFTNPMGTQIGESSDVSWLTLNVDGQAPQGFTSSTSTVLVGNDLDLLENGDLLDVVAIELSVEGVDDVVRFLYAGDATWFDDAAGAIPDFSLVVAAGVQYEAETFADGGGSLFEETIDGELNGALSIKNFGAADGSSEVAPLLPDSIAASSDGGADGFAFDLAAVDVNTDQFVFIDPEVAVGYTYEMTGGGEITALMAPTADAVPDPDGYTITLPGGETFTLLPGEMITLAEPVSTFRISGIDAGLGLDPEDTSAFVMGLKFAGLTNESGILQTPDVIFVDDPVAPAPVPLPAPIFMLLAGMAGLGVVRSRRSA